MAKPKSNQKLELPNLNFDTLGSLTDGTEIPPPAPEPEPPRAATPRTDPAPLKKPKAIDTAKTGPPPTPPGQYDGNGITSPTSPNRPPSSMKRFMSKKSSAGMNASYANSAQGTNGGRTGSVSMDHLSSRPESSLSFISSGGTKQKRKRSWWQKLLGTDKEDDKDQLKRKRTSTLMEVDEQGQGESAQGRMNGVNGLQQHQQPQTVKNRGPPPPQLPQLRGVSRDGTAEGGLGEDMFKDIR